MKKVLCILNVMNFIVTAAFFRVLPETVPMHYDISGNITRYGSRYEEFIYPILTVVFSLIMLFIASLSEKKNGEKSNSRVILIVANIIVVIFLANQLLIMLKACGDVRKVDLNVAVCILMGIGVVALGLVVPKTKRNTLIGIRTKASLKNDENWRKTNKNGGLILSISGIIIILFSFVFEPKICVYVSIGVLILAVIVITILSHTKWQQN